MPPLPTPALPPAARLLALVLLALVLLAALAAPAADAQPAGRDLYVVQPGDTLYRIARASNLPVETLRRLNRVADDRITVGQTLRLSDRVPLPEPGVAAAVAGPAAPTAAPVPARPTPDPRPAPARPAASRPAPPPGAATHTVEPGETLFRIAQRYGMSVDALRRLNALDGDAIQAGQALVVVPARGVAPPAAARPTPAAPAPGRTGARPAPAPVTRPTAAPARAATPRPWSITATTFPADVVHFVEPGETLYSIAVAYGVPVEALAASTPLSTAPLEPGTVLYLPEAVDPATAAGRVLPDLHETGLALVFPDVLDGRPTASGEPYDPLALTASHRDLPLGTLLVVTNPDTGRSTFVRVIDRGPVSQAYLVELSAAAATALGLDPDAARPVELRLVP